MIIMDYYSREDDFDYFDQNDDYKNIDYSREIIECKPAAYIVKNNIFNNGKRMKKMVDA